ncbi:hypothetical protein ABN763_00885 [Spongiivirga sp. MCCC 1A20706]|uniref:hypothetical protein n=1 Tax=Spongiivirga sp. MCCC 1A20706 TaxID=3160963 RepID=UPI00397751C6
MKNKWKNLLIALLAFLGLGAVYGGSLLIISPSGKLLGMPIYLLESTPFNNFLIPGIFLFVINGIAPLLLIIAFIKKPDSTLAERLNIFSDMHWSWSFIIYQAIVLILWIQIQLNLIQGISVVHTFYIVLAIIILLIALQPSIKKEYRM